jgi:5'-nucleotidase
LSGEIITSFPFGNAVVDLEFTAEEIWTMFEGTFHSSRDVFVGLNSLLAVESSGIVSWRNWANREVTSFVQVSRTITFTHAPSLPIGSRLVSLTVSGVPVDRTSNRTYTISTIEFIASGGDGFLYPSKKAGPPLKTLAALLADYVEQKSPFMPFLDGRIRTDVGSRGPHVGGQIAMDINRKGCYGIRCRDALLS